MKNQKIKLYNMSNFDDYILLGLEKTENSIYLIENFLGDINLIDDLGSIKDCLNFVDKKDTIVGDNISVEIIYAKNIIFFMTNVKNKTNKNKLLKRLKENTIFITKQ